MVVTLAGVSVIGVADWPSTAPGTGSVLGAALAAADDGRTGPDGRPLVEVTGDRLRLHPAYVAALDAASAAALGLPPETALALDLKPEGRIDEDDFVVRSRWVSPGGQPKRAELRGALLTAEGAARRVPEPLWSLHRAAAALAAPLPKAERFQALSELRARWPEDARARVESDRYLSELRVHYASRLSLRLGRGGPFDFDPVLFGARAVDEAEAEGRGLDEDLDNILTPASQRLFADDRFRGEADARAVYVLRGGEYVFIDPALRPALGEVRRLQDAPEPERRAFVLNPRRTLRERLETRAGDADFDALFVETEQFSERVAGVDVWRAPVLAWLGPVAKNRWLPEVFGIRHGDAFYKTPPDKVGALIAAVEDAHARGDATADVTGCLEAAEPDGPPPPAELPVNEQTRAAVASLGPFAEALAQAGDHDGVAEVPSAFQRAVAGKLFLVVRENFEEVEFAHFDTPEAQQTAHAPVSPPVRLLTPLKPHQVEGLTWLAAAARGERPGVLLADDMGLGKTLQAIAFMAWLQDEAEAGRREHAPFLVVAPTGLLGNWRDEIVRHLGPPRLGPLLPAFGPELKSLREDDDFRDRDIETGRAALKAESWADAGVVLTTYETLRDYHFSFARTRFGLVVFDEVQKLKNPASQLTRAAKTLNAAFTLAMTGTPVENRLQDLWSIMDVAAPGLLGSSRDFERRHPPTDRTALAALKTSLTEPREGRPPYMLRRLKADALDGLPTKTVHRVCMDMPPVQADAYRDIVVRAAARGAAGASPKGGMLQTLAALRGTSLHPLDPRLAPPDLDIYARDSARLARALETLKAVEAKGEKALVFVEDLAMQERLASLIQARFGLREPPMRINGGVPGPKRQAMVDAFQRDRDRFGVMILSPKAGGVGLTLTAANHVIHLSRWWNPAVEDQATDRVYRIGQTRPVNVYLPLAVHPDPTIRDTSFDLRLDALIERKRSLTRDLFMPPDSDDADITQLFREVSGTVETPDLVAEGVPDSTAPAPVEDTSAALDGAAAQESRSAPSAAPPPLRPVLSLPSTAREAGARIWRAEAGGARPTPDILELFARKDVVHVHIHDPYALARAENRDAQARFVVDLAARTRGVEAVTIEYAPEVEGDLDDAAQRRAFGDLWGRAFPGGGPRLNLARRRRRGMGGDDFHDRSVDLDVRGAGGAVNTHSLLLGRGLEALYDLRRQCTVTYAPPVGHA